jgi:hypothetical protein
MNPARLEAKKVTAAAHSSGVPSRPIGTILSRVAGSNDPRKLSVPIDAGKTEFTVTPFAAVSLAKCFK